ncbi:MAG TPA: AAA family ATPase [Methanofastidiosum sp.]|nr:AAA family ATPase [Methanofastidiosum sp.]HPA49365.1 AAA family ATPase [Methanofastidiosum sp.]HQK62931.1 AAA family ATPase [Methanofastidiosum sp.]
MRILISGVPGVGKTLISKKVAETLNLTYINIGEFAKENFEFPVEEDEIIIDEEAVENKLLGLDNVIIDSHIPFKADKAIILRCNPKILLERLNLRGYSKRKIQDNLMSEVLDYEIYAAKEIFSDEDIYEVLSEDVNETMIEVMNVINGQGISLKNGNHFNFLTEDNLQMIEK